MSFGDIFRNSFMEGYVQVDIKSAVICLGSAALIGIYLFLAYRVMTRNAIYDRSVNMSLPILAIITSGIILSIQSSIVISLGMVGALSIVRFRTAIKSAIDLIFLFWAISIGIICGAGLTMVAILLSLLVTVVLFILDRYPIARASMLLVVNATDPNADESISAVVERYSKHFKVKSRNMTVDGLDMVFECRPEKAAEFVREVMALPGVSHASLVSHDGEVTF